MTFFSQGVNQSTSGVDKVNAILNVHLLTGRIGKPGAGPFSITGQPNAMGGREVGAPLQPPRRPPGISAAPPTSPSSAISGKPPNLATRPGLKAVSLYEAVASKQVRAIWIIGTNPVVSMPNAARVRRSLIRLRPWWSSPNASATATPPPMPISASQPSDGAKKRAPSPTANASSPANAPSSRRQARPAPTGGAIAQVAARMGHGAAFTWRTPADIFREHAALSGTDNPGTRLFDIGALATLTDQAYATMPPHPLAPPGQDHRPLPPVRRWPLPHPHRPRPPRPNHPARARQHAGRRLPARPSSPAASAINGTP